MTFFLDAAPLLAAIETVDLDRLDRYAVAVNSHVVAACGARLTGDVIVMEAAAKVRCTACRRAAA